MGFNKFITLSHAIMQDAILGQ